MKIKQGFVPALGTPLTKEGKFLPESMKKHVNDQIEAGAVGLLCMGSMGIEAFITAEEYPKVAKTTLEAAAGRVPVFVGAMDTSIARVKQRIAPLEDSDVAAFVFTTPFYSACNRTQAMNFFRAVAKLTKHNIMIYDLPGVTRCKITYDMVLELLESVPNFIGIKSADTQMFRKLKLNPNVPKDFITVYSGLDTFDVSYTWGINNCLDGMLSCTPKNTKALFEALERGDHATAGTCLSNIVELRDCFVQYGVMNAFTVSMNLLGYEGNFAQDYCPETSPEGVAAVTALMKKIGEL